MEMRWRLKTPALPVIGLGYGAASRVRPCGGERGWHARLLDPDGNVVYFENSEQEREERRTQTR